MTLKEFVQESKRVFRITKKPDKTEFKTVMKVSGLGILAIGLIGFILYMIDQLIKNIKL